VATVPPGEAYAANCILVNEAVLVARGFRATQHLLGRLDYEVIEVGMSEYRKMDGGLSCLSIRW
jgi:dimethylargininase